MGNNSRKISRIEGLFVAFAIWGALGLTGCHDWPDERVAGIEAQNILRDLSRIETIPDPNIQGPAIYKSPPKKLKQSVGGAEEWKLVYFCQYHTAEEMRQIIHEQFATQLFDEKGKSTKVTDYTVSANPATNQLIVRCPLEADVDAVMEIIKETDIPPIQVRIDCMVSELYADLTMDRETTLLITDLFGEGVFLGGKEVVNSAGVPTGEVLPAFPGAALRDPARAKFGLKVGIWQNDFKALVDILVSRGYLKILMNPTLEVVNGEAAKIQSKQHVPLQQITYTTGGVAGGLVLGTETEYYDVIDSLQITPHVFADGYIGLETSAQIAAYLTPEGIKQTPIVTERTITNKDNRIRLGESLIIGGIRKSEKRDVVRGVPILKDIPILNLLFSGRDFEERATEVIFILTPSISTSGKPNKDMVEMMKERHASPMTQSLQQNVLDPLGTKAREQEQARQLEAARAAQQTSEAERTSARLQAMEQEQQLQDLRAELEQAKAKAMQASMQAATATAQAQQFKTEAEKAKAEAEAKAKAEAEAKAKAEAEAKARAEAEAKAKAEAEKARAAAEKAKSKAASPPAPNQPAAPAPGTANPPTPPPPTPDPKAPAPATTNPT
jgi:Flp pilus assembly secretin CpaC